MVLPRRLDRRSGAPIHQTTTVGQGVIARCRRSWPSRRPRLPRADRSPCRTRGHACGYSPGRPFGVDHPERRSIRPTAASSRAAVGDPHWSPSTCTRPDTVASVGKHAARPLHTPQKSGASGPTVPGSADQHRGPRYRERHLRNLQIATIGARAGGSGIVGTWRKSHGRRVGRSARHGPWQASCPPHAVPGTGDPTHRRSVRLSATVS